MARITAVTGLLLLATALLAGAETSPTGYLAPGLESSGGMRHLCLLYHGQVRRGPRTRETLRTYVACVDTAGKPTDWLFDSFLFIEFATDDDNYSGSSGLTWFGVPGSVTIELPKSAEVARTQMLLFDLDDRYYSYRIDTSLDYKTWEAAVDKSTAEARGWQVDIFPPRQAKFIRLTGLRNSTGQPLMQVIEFEVYGDAESR